MSSPRNEDYEGYRYIAAAREQNALSPVEDRKAKSILLYHSQDSAPRNEGALSEEGMMARGGS